MNIFPELSRRYGSMEGSNTHHPARWQDGRSSLEKKSYDGGKTMFLSDDGLENSAEFSPHVTTAQWEAFEGQFRKKTFQKTFKDEAAGGSAHGMIH